MGLLLSIILLDDLPYKWRDQAMVVTWPLLTASVRSVPKFFRGQILPSWPPIPIRKELTVMFLFHVLVSLWLQFGFLLNQWLIDYPSLLSEDFTRSSFAIATSIEAPKVPRGEIMINSMESFLREEIEGQRWPRATQIISGLVEKRISIDKEVKKRLPNIAENELWKLQGSLVQRQAGYGITLFAVWTGLPLTSKKSYLEKSCEISRTYNQPGRGSDRPPGEALARATLECTPASKPKSGPIPAQGQGFD